MPKIERVNRTTVRGLQKGEKITARGITAERLMDGDIRYSVQIMVDGERIARVIGRESDGVTPTQCEQFIENARANAREGRLNLPQGRKLSLSIAEAAPKYLARLEDEDGRDIENKRRHLTSHLIPYFGSQRLDGISSFGLAGYRKQKRAEGLKDATINRHMATFRHMLNRAASRDWKWIKPEKVPEFNLPEEVRKPIRILTPAQCDDLMRAAAEDWDPDIELFVAFGLNTPMRHDEILARRYEDVDFDRNRIWIDKAKAGEREQPITRALAGTIRRRRDALPEGERNGWIFPAKDKRAKRERRMTMGSQFTRAVERAGLSPSQVTPHVMRHTAITRLVQAKVDIPTIMRISGHKTYRMILHYVHVLPEHVDEAVAHLDMGEPARAITSELPAQANSAHCPSGKVVSFCVAKPAA